MKWITASHRLPRLETPVTVKELKNGFIRQGNFFEEEMDDKTVTRFYVAPNGAHEAFYIEQVHFDSLGWLDETVGIGWVHWSERAPQNPKHKQRLFVKNESVSPDRDFIVFIIGHGETKGNWCRSMAYDDSKGEKIPLHGLLNIEWLDESSTSEQEDKQGEAYLTALKKILSIQENHEPNWSPLDMLYEVNNIAIAAIQSEPHHPLPSSKQGEIEKLKEYFEQQLRLQRSSEIKYTGEEAYFDAMDVCNNIIKNKPKEQGDKSAEEVIIEKMDSMCNESLSPKVLEKWHHVRQRLFENRKDLK